MIGEQYLYFVRHNLRSRLLGERRPLLAGFKITHRCNLRCRACPFWRRPGGDIPFDQAVEVMDRLQAAGVRLLIFEGGEPFLWRDGERRFGDLVAEARRRFFFAGVTTNGTLPLATSANAVWVSIDGLQETHEAHRGPVWERVMENVRESSHPQLLANVTINRLNVREVPALVRHLAGVEQFRGITVQFCYPYADSEDLVVSPADRSWVLQELLALKEQGYPLLDSRPVLRALEGNTWRCHDWLIANAEPDGSINVGCYLKNRGVADCRQCGFAAHAELSLAYDANLAAINTGRQIFHFR